MAIPMITTITDMTMATITGIHTRTAITRTIITAMKATTMDMIMATITAIRTAMVRAASIITNMAPAPTISIITARCRKRSA